MEVPREAVAISSVSLAEKSKLHVFWVLLASGQCSYKQLSHIWVRGEYGVLRLVTVFMEKGNLLVLENFLL